MKINWSVSLTFRGFDQSEEQVMDILDAKKYKIGMRNAPVKASSNSILKKSYAKINLEFSSTPNIFEIIPSIILHAGGLNYLLSAKELLKPKHLEVNIVMPIKKSLEQEGGFITSEAITDLHRLGASLSFEFLEVGGYVG